MTHPNEEQLVLHFYGDADEGAAIEQHLAACEACRANYDALKQTFAAVESLPVPERGPGYGRDVWAQIEPRLDERRGWNWLNWFQPQRLVLTGAMVALLVVAFLLGRFSPGGPGRPGGPTEIAGPGAAAARERILLVAVGDHLERSQMVLIELVNTRASGKVDIASEQNRAEDLVTANRLYRQTAMNVGDTAMASVLDELERTLLEIARSPEKMSGPELAALQKRIESQGILFKVRVVGSQMREREKSAIAAPARGRS